MSAQNDCSDSESANQFAMMSPDDLGPNDYNPNRMTHEGFAELVAEIRHLGRLPKPVIVRSNESGKFAIVDGEHGWRASKEVGLSEIPVEILDIDGFEARRQTYKRNRHGEHNPILLGRMFAQMKAERGLSNVQLAKEIEISEGTVRNALMSAEAFEARNGYDQSYDAAAEIGALNIKQLRAYMQLAPKLRNHWLDTGASIAHLLAFRSNYTVEEIDELLKEQRLSVTEQVEKNLNPLEDFGYVDYYRTQYTADGFANELKRLERFYNYEHRWLRVGQDKGLSQDALRPYTHFYFSETWAMRNEDMMDSVLNTIMVVDEQVVSFLVTPDELSAMVDEVSQLGINSHGHFMDVLKSTLKNRDVVLAKTKSGARSRLYEQAMEANAPEYIKNSTLYPAEVLYVLWRADGDEEIKRRIAAQRYLSIRDGYEMDAADAVEKEIELFKGRIAQETARREAVEKYKAQSKDEILDSRTARVFGDPYKDDPDGYKRTKAKLAKLSREDLFYLDQLTEVRKATRDNLAKIRAITVASGSG